MFRRSLRKLLDRSQVTIKDYYEVPFESDSRAGKKSEHVSCQEIGILTPLITLLVTSVGNK